MNKQKIKDFFNKILTPYVFGLFLWSISYLIFCLHPSNLCLGVTITCLIFAETNYIADKIKLKSEIFESFDRLITYLSFVVEQNKSLQKEMAPFRDEYFKDLSAETIAQLAKTRLNVGAEAQEYRHALESIREVLVSSDEANNNIAQSLKTIAGVLNEQE